MQNYLLRNIQIVNEGKISTGDVLISDGRIEKIAAATGQYPRCAGNKRRKQIPIARRQLTTRCIFGNPGSPIKAQSIPKPVQLWPEGVTSFMEMPNTQPPALTQELLEEKYAIAANVSLANYSFFMGTSNDNMDEALKTNDKKNDICGIKIFMGSSTGKYAGG